MRQTGCHNFLPLSSYVLVLLSNRVNNHRCSCVSCNILDNLVPCPTAEKVCCLHPWSSLLPKVVVYWLLSSLTVCCLLSLFLSGIIRTVIRRSAISVAYGYQPWIVIKAYSMCSLGSPNRIPLWYIPALYCSQLHVPYWKVVPRTQKTWGFKFSAICSTASPELTSCGCGPFSTFYTGGVKVRIIID